MANADRSSEREKPIHRDQQLSEEWLDFVSGGWEVSVPYCGPIPGGVACGVITVRGGGDESAYSATARR